MTRHGGVAAVVLVSAILSIPATIQPSAAAGECSQPVSAGANPVSSDCLYILRVAVGLLSCSPECVCAPTGSLPSKATDALLCLSVAVGIGATLDCPCGVTLSGQVTASSSSGSFGAGSPPMSGSDEAVVDGTVELFKIFPDGTEESVDIGAVTTDETGSYEIPDVEIAETGNGEDSDFYYEVRVSDGAGTDVRAPAAPSDDTTVDVSPGTNLAARILSEVAEVPGETDLATPSEDLIEAVRELVKEDAEALADDGSIAIPETVDAEESDVVASANGIAAAGGDAEKLYKAVQFEAEQLTLTNDDTATAEDAGAYIKRVTREGADQIADRNPLPEVAADALGAALLDGETYTPAELVAAYNANNGPDPSAVLDQKIDQFVELLAAVEEKFDDAPAAPEDLTGESQAALYTKRDLESDTFDADTPLDPDQAIAFLQTLPLVESDPNSKVGGFSPNVDVTAIVSDLTDDPTLTTPAIADVQIYHDSGFNCDQQAGFGHFVADVEVYAPALAVVSVNVASSDSTALDGDGSVDLVNFGNRWTSNTPGVCVTLGDPVTYFIEATLSDTSVISAQVDRNHPLVPEALTTVDGVPTSNDINNPDVFDVKRPLYSWEPPEVKLASIVDAPAGSTVKYTYEFSHVTKSGPLSGGPLNPDTYPGCTVVFGAGSRALYSVDSFLPTVDCDTAACAASTGEAESNVICRINIQTFLVDPYDRILGQAAGRFAGFCVDDNANGDCGS
jgi:hypothetical protein